MNLNKLFKHTVSNASKGKYKKDRKAKHSVFKQIKESAKQGRTEMSTTNKTEILYIMTNQEEFESAGFKVFKVWSVDKRNEKPIKVAISWADEVEEPLPKKEEPLEGSSKTVHDLEIEMLSTDEGRNTHNSIISSLNVNGTQRFLSTTNIEHIVAYRSVYENLGYKVAYLASPDDGNSIIIIYGKGDEPSNDN